MATNKIYQLSDILPFGKHKGRTIDSVIGENVSYVRWLYNKGIIRVEDDVIKKAVRVSKENQYNRDMAGYAKRWMGTDPLDPGPRDDCGFEDQGFYDANNFSD